MADYLDLVSKVLDNDILKEAVDSMINANNLNLVTSDWESQLNNDPTFQKFISPTFEWIKRPVPNSNYEFEQTKDRDFNIILVGNCIINSKIYGKIQDKPSITIVNSEPLSKIAQAICSDFGSDVQVSSDFKFNFNKCGFSSCASCSKCFAMFKKAGYNVDTKYVMPCISDTRVFDGKRIVNRFFSQIESTYSQNFTAIIHLNINARYKYIQSFGSYKQKLCRISGDISDIVTFHENKLASPKTVDVGPLVSFEIPAVTTTAAAAVDNEPHFSEKAATIMMEDEIHNNFGKHKMNEEEKQNKKAKFFEEEEEEEKNDAQFIDQLLLE